MFLKTFSIFTFLSIHFFCFAQSKEYTFYAIDANTLQAIPNLNVVSEKDKTAYQSNAQGLIQIFNSNPKNTFLSYHLSYISIKISLETLQDTIFFTYKEYQLPSVELQNLSAVKMLEKAINRIEKNYPQSISYLEGKYKQIHKEDQKYVRYIEAHASVKKSGYSKNIKLPQEEKFAIKHLRKSYNYEQNGDQHGDHLVDLFLNDPLQYLDKSILNINNLGQYDWQFSSIQEELYMITFQNKVWASQQNLSGEIVITKDDYAITAITIIETPNAYSKSENLGTWQFVNGWYEINFMNVNGEYILSNSKKWYHHLVKDENNHSIIKHEVEEQFIWQTDITQEREPNLNYTKLTNLYSRSMPYNSSEWLENLHLEEVKNDLEHKYTLDYQFSNP